MIELDKNIDKIKFATCPCFSCDNYLYDDVCKAFDNGIPENILEGRDKHIEKHPEQDNSIVFEPIKNE